MIEDLMTKGYDQRARPMLLFEAMLLSDLSAHSTLCASSMGTKPSAEDMMSAADDCITPPLDLQFLLFCEGHSVWPLLTALQGEGARGEALRALRWHLETPVEVSMRPLQN
jgi:hypothetical protein